jgi:uncharacterized membrane protein
MAKPHAPLSVVMAFYEDPEKARASLDALKRLQKQHAIRILDAAIMTRDLATDRIKITETAEITPKKGATRGAIAGGVLAVIFPPTILALGLTGAALGLAFGHFTDQGFDNNLLREIAENLPPHGVALVGVVEELWMETVNQVISGYDDLRLFRLDPEAAAHLVEVTG